MSRDCEPSPEARALAAEVVRRADEMARMPRMLWEVSDGVRREGFDFLADALVGLRLDGATDEECDALCRLVFAVIARAEDASRRALEERDEYRIEGAGE